MILLFI